MSYLDTCIPIIPTVYPTVVATLHSSIGISNESKPTPD
jgi:hypothetical protein